MATKPTPGGSDGTYGSELNVFLNESFDVDGKIKTEALQTDSTAPVADAAVANKKYVDSGASSVLKAWANVDGSNGALNDGLNTSSVRDSEGVYTITWTTPFASANYAVVCLTDRSHTEVTSQVAGSCVISTKNPSFAALDCTALNIMAAGVQ